MAGRKDDERLRRKTRAAGGRMSEAWGKGRSTICQLSCDLPYPGAGPVVPAYKSGLVLAAAWGRTTAPVAFAHP